MGLPKSWVAAVSATACLFALQASAQEASRVTVLQGGRIIDGLGGPPIENGNIVVRAGRIEAIQPAGATVPADAEVVDMRGKTLMPALVAGHAHLGLTNGTTAAASNNTEANVTRQLKKYMQYGIGTVASFGTDYDFIYRLRASQKNGQLTVPSILTAGHGFGVPGGVPPIEMGMDRVYRPVSVAEVRKDMDELAANHPDLVKVWVDDFGNKSTRKMDPALYQEVIRQAHKHGLKVAAHVYYLEDAKRLARDGVDIFGHSVRDKPVDAELIELMKKRNIAYIPTLGLDEASFVYGDRPEWMETPSFKQALDPGVWEWLRSPAYKVKASARKDLAMAQSNVLALHKAGIRVGLGTDSGATVARIQGFAEHRELQLLTTAGITPMQALLAGTAVNASILGIDGERGVLAPGKRADILVLDANPLDDIRNTQKIDSVWLNGAEVSKSR